MNDDVWLTFTMPWGLARFWWLMRKSSLERVGC
jgi:hypothetical protein